MTEAIDKNLDWFAAKAKQFGLPLLILFGVWYLVKRLWFWAFMPLLFVIFLKQITLVFDWTWFERVHPTLTIGSWVFLFSLGKAMFK